MIKVIFNKITFYIAIAIISLPTIVNSSPKTILPENPIFIQKGNESYSLNRHISILKDTSGKWNIREVTSDSLSSMFVKVNKDAPNFGFSSSVFWIRFRVIDTLTAIEKKDENFSDNWLLINKYPSLEDVRLYYRDSLDGNFIEKNAGLISFVKSNTIHNIEFVSQLPVQKNMLKTFYLRISTPSPVIISFQIMSIRSFLHRHSKRLFFYGIMFGIFFLIIIYNLARNLLKAGSTKAPAREVTARLLRLASTARSFAKLRGHQRISVT